MPFVKKEIRSEIYRFNFNTLYLDISFYTTTFTCSGTPYANQTLNNLKSINSIQFNFFNFTIKLLGSYRTKHFVTKIVRDHYFENLFNDIFLLKIKLDK